MDFDQPCDCDDQECVEKRRKIRTALFDYMKCREFEAFEGWENEAT